MLHGALNVMMTGSGARCVLLMGVSGSGKTTVGRLLAAKLGWRFLDADDFHSASNIAKMSSGIPLADDDRLPWLESLRRELELRRAAGESCVLACSALKERYRETLRASGMPLVVVHLRGREDLLRGRSSVRVGHFMPSGLLGSQMADLEPPRDALEMDVSASPEEVTAAIVRALARP